MTLLRKDTDRISVSQEEVFLFNMLNQITHPVREAFLVFSADVASAVFFVYYKADPNSNSKQRKTLRMTA